MVQHGAQAESFKADDLGRIRIRLQKDWLAGDTQIVSSDAPLEIKHTVSAVPNKGSNDLPGGQIGRALAMAGESQALALACRFGDK